MIAMLRSGLGVLLLLASAAGSAAAVHVPLSDAPSDLFLVLVSLDTGHSEVVDLGPIVPGSPGRREWRIDRRYAEALGRSRLVYQVVAGDVTAQGFNRFTGIRLYTTCAPESVRLMTPKVWVSARIAGAVTLVDAYLSVAAPGFSLRDGWLTYRNPGSTVTNWGPINARPSAPGTSLGLPGFDASAPIGAGLPFFSLTAGPADVGLATDATIEEIGRFTMRGRVLTYVPSSAGASSIETATSPASR